MPCLAANSWAMSDKHGKSTMLSTHCPRISPKRCRLPDRMLCSSLCCSRRRKDSSKPLSEPEHVAA